MTIRTCLTAGTAAQVSSVVFVDSSSVLNTAKYLYYGSTMVWFAKPSSAAAWVVMPSGNAQLVAYTPTTTMSVASFSIILSINTNYDLGWGIWTVSGSTATPVSNACGTGTTGVTIVEGAPFSTSTEYMYTKTYTSGSRPTLVAGTTYYFYIGERYSQYSVVSGSSAAPGYVYSWALSATASITYVAGATSNLWLSVTSA